jgi:hypothetical protein
MKNFVRFTATPEDTYVPYKRRKKPQPDYWVAPEHWKFARNMDRDYERDHDGRPIRENGKRLVLDPRPEIMIPKRTPIHLGVDL